MWFSEHGLNNVEPDRVYDVQAEETRQTLWLTMKYVPDNNDEPVGVYSTRKNAQMRAHRDAQVTSLVWDVDEDDWWWTVHPSGGVEYAVYEITVDKDL